MAYLLYLLIVVSYFLYSSKTKGATFKKWNVLWGLLIIVISSILGKINLTISQLLIIILVFYTDFYVVKKFSEKFRLSLNNYLISSGVISAPLIEEIFFRGYLINQIDGDMTRKIIISSILFGLYHLKNFSIMEKKALIYQIVYAGLFIGPILAWTRLETGSIFLPIIIHSINNTLSHTLTRLWTPSLARYKELDL